MFYAGIVFALFFSSGLADVAQGSVLTEREASRK